MDTLRSAENSMSIRRESDNWRIQMIFLSLREIQLKELELLCWFDELCKKNGLYYTLAGGTLLGAITQSPMGMGKVTIDVLLAIARGDAYEELYDTGCAWYTAENMADDNIAPNLYD